MQPTVEVNFTQLQAETKAANERKKTSAENKATVEVEKPEREKSEDSVNVSQVDTRVGQQVPSNTDDVDVEETHAKADIANERGGINAENAVEFMKAETEKIVPRRSDATLKVLSFYFPPFVCFRLAFLRFLPYKFMM